MGYIVSGSGEIFLPAEDMNAAYQALMELNKHDELKRGGVWSEGVQTESHFSWMPADLSTLPTVHAIFTALGFTTVIDEDGLWVHEYESNKTGQEGLFFAAIAPFIKHGGYFFWDGEDKDFWKWSFTNGKMYTMNGIHEYDPVGEEISLAAEIKATEEMLKGLKKL